MLNVKRLSLDCNSISPSIFTDAVSLLLFCVDVEAVDDVDVFAVLLTMLKGVVDVEICMGIFSLS